MNRFWAILLLALILFGGWSFYNSPTAMASLDPSNSPVLFTYEGRDISLAYVLFFVVIFIAWLALGVLIFSFDPYVGYTYFRVSIELFVIHVLRQKDFKLPKRTGEGSGDGFRVG